MAQFSFCVGCRCYVNIFNSKMVQTKNGHMRLVGICIKGHQMSRMVKNTKNGKGLIDFAAKRIKAAERKKRRAQLRRQFPGIKLTKS